MGDHEKQAQRRRLLDQLEQRIGAVSVQVLGAVEDADAVAPCPRGPLEHARSPPHLVDPDLAEKLAGLVVPFPPQNRDVAIAARRRPGRTSDASRAPTGRARCERLSLAGSGLARTNRAKRHARVALPIPSRPADQPGVRQPAPAECVEHFGLGRHDGRPAARFRAGACVRAADRSRPRRDRSAS